MRYEVFLSCKHLNDEGQPTRASELAEQIHAFLTSKGLAPFYSGISLEQQGVALYKKAIDAALDECSVLVAIGTSPEDLLSEWVRYEWHSFFNDILSGIKPKGRVFTYVEGVLPNQLPRPLRQTQMIVHAPDSVERLYQFIRRDDAREPSVADISTPALPSHEREEQFVYISYAAEDQGVALKVMKALRIAGIHVYDPNSEDLKGGDAWAAATRHKIQSCEFFIPLISRATEKRLEGYFRREWNLASERSLNFREGYPFILPIVVDDLSHPEHIPPQFQTSHYLRAESDSGFAALVQVIGDNLRTRS